MAKIENGVVSWQLRVDRETHLCDERLIGRGGETKELLVKSKLFQAKSPFSRELSSQLPY